MEEKAQIGWRRSSRCESNGCVEVSMGPDTVSLRDSKIINGPTLAFNHADWASFVGAIKVGEFD